MMQVTEALIHSSFREKAFFRDDTSNVRFYEYADDFVSDVSDCKAACSEGPFRAGSKELLSIRKIILSNGFYVLDTKKVIMSRDAAEEFYLEHQNKFYYNRLVSLMSSGPSFAHILARENAIQLWRDIMGPTKVFKAQFTHPYSIRGMHGLSDTRNAVHGSDSYFSAVREIKLFFPDFDCCKWSSVIAECLKTEAITFDSEKFVHHIPFTYTPFISINNSCEVSDRNVT